ncbi:MAG TPA: hypothetical protein DCQ20_10735 [Nitrospira sp.]|nr:hypothetical protein [Nitrospira sp.]
MKGTITDFLKLVSAKPELSRELIELAARHGFEFSVDELSDNDLQGIVGGFSDVQRASDNQLADINCRTYFRSSSNSFR